MEMRMQQQWTVTFEYQELRLVSLALLGKIKPDTKEAEAAVALIKRINDRRLAELESQAELLKGHMTTLGD
jgi:hypothetical protein